jgi:hypothetical protein
LSNIETANFHGAVADAEAEPTVVVVCDADDPDDDVVNCPRISPF